MHRESFWRVCRWSLMVIVSENSTLWRCWRTEAVEKFSLVPVANSSHIDHPLFRLYFVNYWAQVCGCGPVKTGPVCTRSGASFRRFIEDCQFEEVQNDSFQVNDTLIEQINLIHSFFNEMRHRAKCMIWSYEVDHIEIVELAKLLFDWCTLWRHQSVLTEDVANPSAKSVIGCSAQSSRTKVFRVFTGNYQYSLSNCPYPDFILVTFWVILCYYLETVILQIKPW